jgi:hypothetical protein
VKIPYVRMCTDDIKTLRSVRYPPFILPEPFLKNQIAGKTAMADMSIPALCSPVPGIFHRRESDMLCPFPKINPRSSRTGSILRINDRFK